MDNKTLSEEAILERRKYQKAYYNSHKEQAKLTMAKYWEKKALKSKEEKEGEK